MLHLFCPAQISTPFPSDILIFFKHDIEELEWKENRPEIENVSSKCQYAMAVADGNYQCVNVPYFLTPSNTVAGNLEQKCTLIL